MKIKRYSFKAFVLISLILILYMLPTYLGFTTLFNDDCMQQSFPRLVAVARQIQRGEIPLWDKNTYSGARPLYITFETPIYNILLYPFFLMADTNNLNQCYFVLFLIPFTLYMIASAFACYLIGKSIFKINDLASILIGISYATSPLYAISFDSLLNTSTHTMMVFVIFFVAKFIEEKKLKWYILALIFDLFLNLTFQFNYFIRNHFVILLFAILMILFSSKKIIEKLKTFFTTITIFIFSTLLISFILAGILEGVIALKAMGLKTEDLSEQNSMHPLNLFTLIIPNFFGINDGVNALGLGIDSIWSASTLSGGVLVTLVTVCIIVFIFLKNKDMNLKKWSLISIILSVIALISLLGRFTPIYKILGYFIPVYRIPHPVYFNNLQGLSVAFLSGIGLHIIATDEKIKSLFLNIKGVFIIIISLIFLVFIVTNITFLLKGEPINPIFTINKLIEHKWFFSDSGLYFIISIILLLVLSIFRNKEYFEKLIFVFMVLEALFVGEQVLYERNELLLPETVGTYRDTVLGNYRWPSDSPMYQKLKEIKELSDKLNCRFTGSISEIDNLSWVLDNKALFGYDSKPLIIYLYDLINEFGRYDMYEMWNIRFARRFLQNMNVGLFVAHRGVVTNKDKDVFLNENDNECYYIRNDEDTIQKFENGELGYDEIFKAPDLEIYMVPDYLPYVYTNDVIREASDEEQKNKILYHDLRDAVYLNKNDFDELKEFFELQKEGKKEQFNELQNINKIKNINLKYANKLEIDADIKKNAILVISEVYHPGWKAYVDGKKRKVYKINYLQQGVFVKDGDKKIVLKFMPKLFYFGLSITLLICVLLLVALIILVIKRKR